jgi:predicted nucleic-acid-binding protein
MLLMALFIWRYDNSSVRQLVSETIRQWTIRQRQFVSESIEKTVKSLAGYGVKCILAQEWIKSVVSTIVELEELSIKMKNLCVLMSKHQSYD